MQGWALESRSGDPDGWEPVCWACRRGRRRRSGCCVPQQDVLRALLPALAGWLGAASRCAWWELTTMVGWWRSLAVAQQGLRGLRKGGPPGRVGTGAGPCRRWPPSEVRRQGACLKLENGLGRLRPWVQASDPCFSTQAERLRRPAVEERVMRRLTLLGWGALWWEN